MVETRGRTDPILKVSDLTDLNTVHETNGIWVRGSLQVLPTSSICKLINCQKKYQQKFG